ncbi:hypothetical protein PI125_g683 [Phytophthora idaei]|nr:hypothetical protein PI125_g683 [Phytophthora idaei]
METKPSILYRASAGAPVHDDVHTLAGWHNQPSRGSSKLSTQAPAFDKCIGTTKEKSRIAQANP